MKIPPCELAPRYTYRNFAEFADAIETDLRTLLDHLRELETEALQLDLF